MGWIRRRGWPVVFVRVAALALSVVAGSGGCMSPPTPSTPTPSAAAIFSPPSPVGPPPAAPLPSPSQPGPISTRVSIVIPGGTQSPSPSARPGGVASPSARARPATNPSPGAAGSPSPAASPTPGPLAGTLVYERAGSIVIQGAAGGEARTLVAGSDLSTPRWSPDGKLVLFTGGTSQAAELYVVAATGGQPRRLTSNARPERGAAWSPRGNEVVYSLPRSLGPNGDISPVEPEEIWIVDVATGTERKVADGFDPAWAPDASRLAYASNGRRDEHGAADNAIHVVLSDGSGDRPVLAVSALPADLQPAYNLPFRPGAVRLRAPSWAPDGRRLVATADGRTGLAVTFDDQGQDLRPWALAFEGAVGRARWAPRGGRLAIESRPATGVDVVLIVDPQTGAERQIGGIEAGFSVGEVAWAPDGSRVALVSGPPTGRAGPNGQATELRLYLADGSPIRSVASGMIGGPKWTSAGP